MTTRVEILRAVSPRSRSLAFGLTFLLLAAMTCSIAFIPHMAFVALSVCYLGLFVAYMGFRPDSQGGDLFEIIVPFSILSFIYCGVGTTFLAIKPDALQYPALAPFLLPALALTTLGFLCLLIGYGWFFRNTPPSGFKGYEPKNIMIYVIPGALGAAGMSVQELQNAAIWGGGVSPVLSFIQQFGQLFYFAWFLAWYMLWAKRLRLSVVVPIILMLSGMMAVILFFTFGGKGLAAILIGMPALAYYEVKRRFPWKSVAAVVLIFIFFIFPTYNAYRSMNQSLGTSRRVDQAVTTVQKLDSERYLDASLFAFLKRVAVGTSVAAIIADTGRWVDYRYGDTLILAPIALFIPRFIWPEKPNISIGRDFADIFRLRSAVDRETYISTTMVGDLYWNFSIPGVILGMGLIGMGYRWWYQRYGAGHGVDPIRKSMYFCMLPTAMGFEGNVAFVLAFLVKLVVILTLFLIISRRLGWIKKVADA